MSCISAHSSAQLAHDGGGACPASHDVADDQRHPAATEANDVIPVATDLASLPTREVPGGQLHAGQQRQRLGQQAALQGLGNLVFLLVALGVLDGDGGQLGQLEEHNFVALGEVAVDLVGNLDEPK